MQQTGFFWHVHHDELLEWCFGYDERFLFIKHEKAEVEQEPRLRLFQPVKGVLPEAVLKTRVAYMEAKNTKDVARDAYIIARNTCGKEVDALNETTAALNEARVVYIKTLSEHRSEIEALHKAECPDCPWDGHTIFPAA